MLPHAWMIQKHVSRAGRQPHVRHLAILRDGKFDRQQALLHGRRFGNQVIPVLFHIMENTFEVRSEVYALCIARERLCLSHNRYFGTSGLRSWLEAATLFQEQARYLARIQGQSKETVPLLSYDATVLNAEVYPDMTDA